jgi:hypothetical protein
MRTEEPADTQEAVAAEVRPAGRGLDAGDLSPAGVLALQRAAGNRVPRRILARDKSLDDQVAGLQAKIAAATTVGDALKQEAKALAAKCWANSATDADAARGQVRRIVGALMSKNAQDTGIDVAAATKDAAVERSALAQMGNSSIAGMENYLVKMGRWPVSPWPPPAPTRRPRPGLMPTPTRSGRPWSSFRGRGSRGSSRPISSRRSSAKCSPSYLSVVPHEKDPTDPSTDRAAHAVVLFSHDSGGTTSYAGVSDFYVKAFAATTEAAAKQELLDLALDIYSTKGIPKKYRSYYVAAGPGGAYDVKILDPVNKGLTPWKTVP